MVDLPEADKPVSQMVRPFCLRRPARMGTVSGVGWNVMLLRSSVSFEVLVDGGRCAGSPGAVLCQDKSGEGTPGPQLCN
jgi:hypothetical protein